MLLNAYHVQQGFFALLGIVNKCVWVAYFDGSNYKRRLIEAIICPAYYITPASGDFLLKEAMTWVANRINKT